MKVEVTERDIDAAFEALQKELAPRAECCAVSQAVHRKRGVNFVSTGHYSLGVSRWSERQEQGQITWYYFPDRVGQFIREFDRWSRWPEGEDRPKPISFEAKPTKDNL
ncbi:hypothetical protein BJD55_gp073 [Gordonia phage Yvonnetastic]|uniref:Uncharacterized protein n=1 Tax=Gordonia phage Yvonnetastic TaxID=1821566 RepID=A0A142K9B0_9CAUD|nr:hypothetical protein BJD55_gp073 [Gordonia phage Yvonnetastic]AMS02693.1 hypothetical protein SEA_YVONNETASTIC_149 [Gordonia phage Yvonnetastic]